MSSYSWPKNLVRTLTFFCSFLWRKIPAIGFKYSSKMSKEGFNPSITWEANLKAVDFLNITLDLTNGKYQPYLKSDNNSLYINILSNQSPNIIKYNNNNNNNNNNKNNI